MHRPGLVALAAAFACTCGCELLHVFKRPPEPPGTKLKMPKSPTISAKTYENGQRVEDVGQQILTQNTFPGISPLFHTLGVKESVLFHRGSAELFVSEGLVERCKTDDELAAVLCTELGKMKAEKQAAKRVGVDRDGLPESPDPAADSRPTSAAEPSLQVGDATAYANELLTRSGFDPAAAERVAPLVREAEKNDAIRKQMAGSAPAPKWQK